MNLSRLHPRHFWSTESGLTGLLIFSLGYFIVLNSLSDSVWQVVPASFSLIVAGVLYV
jgi:hypothetical protein